MSHKNAIFSTSSVDLNIYKISEGKFVIFFFCHLLLTYSLNITTYLFAVKQFLHQSKQIYYILLLEVRHKFVLLYSSS